MYCLLMDIVTQMQFCRLNFYGFNHRTVKIKEILVLKCCFEISTFFFFL